MSEFDCEFPNLFVFGGVDGRKAYMFPSGEGGFEGGESASGVGVGGVLRQQGLDEAVQHALLLLHRPRRRRRTAAELGELLGEAVKGQKGVADGGAFFTGGAAVAGKGVCRRRRVWWRGWRRRAPSPLVLVPHFSV